MEDVSKFLVGRTEEYANAAERPTGTVSVPSGRLRIIDPFFEARYGCVLWVPPGQHRAFITYIHIDDDLGWRPAYLSIRFTEAQPATVAFADFLIAPPVSMVTGAVSGSDNAMIAVYDADAKIDPKTLVQTLFVDLDTLTRTPIGATNVITDSGAHVVACRTGRDGAFPILATRTATGDLTAIHIDFYWVDFDPGDDIH
ncbi:DUF4241 domain-containing protein [Mycolicibacterium fluoranthenivorans]|uniref:DUF4241 domain-containing protein n=1 Tax=Mycolicibacterium fluoranthenivorans TaxID=258505 RepID=A0A1G4X1Z1_9MYCO|nr:DUF4241 domain-containing protein [Mycolicibacterium fluoranthenivorans]SCX34169.1 Protein of unknown function [Mycolicibacterium fluoranthenivorans]